jgi:hypothetical protein
MKYYLALVALFLFFGVRAQNAVSDYFVTDISQNNEIKISTADLNKLTKECGQTTNITELKVQKVGDHYVLLAKDIAQKLILAFELKSDGTKLYVDINKVINACESQTISLSIFTIIDGQISGCIKVNHRVLGRY